MKKKLLMSLMAVGFVFSMASGASASAASVHAPPICDGSPPLNAPCIPKYL